MKKIVSIFLIICVVFNLTSCVSGVKPLDNQTPTLIEQYEDASTDELLAKIVANALSGQYLLCKDNHFF